jgi:hypothetical protein
MMKLQRITIERAFIPIHVNVFTLRKKQKDKKKTEGTNIFVTLILPLFLLFCVRTIVGWDEGEEEILNRLLKKRDSVFEEWEMEENAHLRAVEQLKKQQEKFIRHTEAWEQISTGSNPDTETPMTVSTTTVESLIASGLEMAAQKPLQSKDSKIEQDMEEKVVIEKVVGGTSSSGISDDDDGSIPAGLIAIAVLPGVAGVFVILVLIGLGLRAVWSKRNQAVKNATKVYHRDTTIPFQAIPRHIPSQQQQQQQVVIPQQYLIREYPIQ